MGASVNLVPQACKGGFEHQHPHLPTTSPILESYQLPAVGTVPQRSSPSSVSVPV